MDKYVCIHGHFYQPPRENPWLEDVELQDSAYPYHDWNTRITQECYRQNAASRILGQDRKIVDIVNNYCWISFNFGPTLLSWLETHAPDVYEKILEADRLGHERFSGHGPALAQPYNHMILPLSNARDKVTQVTWGIRDFERRFGRRPEGMWLPETAADAPTLEVLAEQGIRFTILSPRQARRVRKGDGNKRWRNVNEHEVDPTVPYLCRLPSGKALVVFFYNGPVAHDVAYGGLLHSGENLSGRLMSAFPNADERARLVHVATDGESFGHHHRHGDMALAYCLHHITDRNLARVTIYGEYLDKVPVEDEAEIWDNSSWSCAHGIERWRSNCGCCANQSLSGQQAWRAPLRETLDWLRDQCGPMYEQAMGQFSPDPWQTRNDYIAVMADRSRDCVEAFIRDHTQRELTSRENVTFLKLLENQRNAMLMYTSCGWFFDRISGIETVQILQYACRAMQLHRDVHQVDLEPEFKQRLDAAPNTGQPYANGRQVYEAYVEHARVDLSRVGAHVALSSVFEKQRQDRAEIYCYAVDMKACTRLQAGIQVLITGSAGVESKITMEQSAIDLAVFYLGDHHLFGAVRPQDGQEAFQALQEQIQKAFRRGDSNEVMRLMNTSLGGTSYSLSHLFKDEQRRILDQLLENTRNEIEGSFRHIYEHNYSIMQMVGNLKMPLPAALAGPATFVVNRDILRELRSEVVRLDRLQALVEEVAGFTLRVDLEGISLEGSRLLNDWMQRLNAETDNVTLLEQTARLLESLRPLTPKIDIQSAQNTFFRMSRTHYPAFKGRAASDDASAVRWVELFQKLAGHLDLALC